MIYGFLFANVFAAPAKTVTNKSDFRLDLTRFK